MPPKVPLYLKILASIFLSVAFSIFYEPLGLSEDLILRYLTPVGEAFLSSIKLLVVPLILTSLVVSISNLKNVTQLTMVGIKTMVIYALTTLFSVTLGLLLGIWLQPGAMFPKALSTGLTHKAVETTTNGLPENLFKMFMDNHNIIYIVIFAFLVGAALLNLPAKKRNTLVLISESLHDLFIVLMQWVMKLAPIGVFSLTSTQLIKMSHGKTDQISEYLFAFLPYIGTVLLGLSILTFIFYPMLTKVFTGLGWSTFINTMRPAQMIAFSTSSSTVALPTSMKQVEKLGVPKEISEFVLPLGAAINIDGTALYQGVATLFLAQVFGIELSLSQYALIVGHVTFSSIGLGGIPSGSLASLSMLLGQLGIPVGAGIGLVVLTDRLLDMARSATNITGDATVAVLVGLNNKKEPQVPKK